MLDPTIKNPLGARTTRISVAARAYLYLLLTGLVAALILIG